MKIQGRFFLFLSLFFLIVAIVYGYWSHETAGTVALFLAFGLSIMIGFYLSFTARRMDQLAQDNKEADVADQAGEVGFFSPHSWAPVSLGVGGALAFLSVAIGWWLLYFSAPLIMYALYGWVFEYYQGESRNQ